MKKILFAAAMVALLAAGCSQPSSYQSSADTSAHVATPNPAPVQSQTQASVKVNGADDALNLLEKNSTNEQTASVSSDDSDLVASGSADLNAFTEVPNGN